MLKFLSLLIALTIPLASFPQRNQPQYEHITVDNGLPNAHVTKFVEDRYGYVWIGTENGLVRYDGYEKKTYKLSTAGGQDLQSMNIQELFEDSKGNIWVGTFYDGFFQYDRKKDQFEQFGGVPGPNNRIATNDVHGIQEDGDGNLYIYTYDHPKGIGYINQYDFKTKKYRRFGPDQKGKNHTPNLPVMLSWHRDGKGQIWIGADNGLYVFDKKEDRFVGYLVEQDTAAALNLSRIYPSPSNPNMLYCADQNFQHPFKGVIEFNTVTKTSSRLAVPELQPAPGRVVYSFYEDQKKQLWIGSTSGLTRYDRQSGKSSNFIIDGTKDGTGRNSVFSITGDQSGLIWLSVANGMAHFYPDNGQIVFHNSLFKDEMDPDRLYYFQNAFQDKAGNLWLKDREGVHRVKREYSNFNHYKRDLRNPLSFSGGYLFGLSKQSAGRYFLSAYKGWSTWDLKTDEFRTVPYPKEFAPTDIILKFDEDQSGYLWGGLMKSNNEFKGLFRYDPKTKNVKFYKHDPANPRSPQSDFISYVFVDSKNQVWIGTYNKGLSRYNRETDDFTRFPFTFRETKKPEGELDDLSVSCIYEDKTGTIWVGTMKGGLNRFDPATNTFKAFFDPKKGMRHITSILEDKKGRFWAGSETYGLNLVDRKTGVNQLFSEKDGLLSNGIVSISEDQSGNLWLSTTRGLSRFDPDQKKFRSLTADQGLPSTRLTATSLRLDDGRMLVSSYGGFFTFDPAKLTINTVPPKVHITSVSYFENNPDNKDIREVVLPVFDADNIELTHRQNRLDLRFVGIHYQNPQLNRYQYRLEGYETNWVNAGTQRNALYTNLGAGTYTFHVKASNADGVWNETGDSFTFTILPPWWQTWWAYLIYIFIFAVGLRSYTYFRSRALRRENQLLEEKIDQRTQELSNANKTLNQQRDQLSEALDELKSAQQQLIQSEKLASLGELTAGIAHEIQNPLNFVNNFSEVSAELVEEMEEEMKKGDQEEALAIAGDLRLNLQKIMHHGQRAGGIVKSMLQHSRKNSGEKELTDMNALADEFLKLSYHGLRAKDSTFNSKITTSFAPDLPEINMIPQDIGRVLLNLFNNAFYAVQQRQKKTQEAFEPEVTVSTRVSNGYVLLEVLDNGTGIPDSIRDKILQPFFTTKPTGEGTGLGLSLSYDILKTHGGKMDVESKEGEFTRFCIYLPLNVSP